MKKLIYLYSLVLVGMAVAATSESVSVNAAAVTAAEPNEPADELIGIEPVKTTFTDQELSLSKNENLFDLGQINTPVNKKNIKAPSRKESFIAFDFITEDGLPVNFLIRRTSLGRDRFEKLKAATPARQTFRQQVGRFFQRNNEALLTSFYVRHTANGPWTEVYSVTDDAGSYRFSPKFDARIYPNGLIVLDVKGKENMLFGAGKKTATQLLVGPDRIEIGNGKTASAKEIAEVNI